MIDFGETFSSPNYEIRDTTGALQNAGTVTITVTLPDLTTASPTANNPSAGVYNFDYLTTQAGRHQVLVSATGGILGSLVRRWVDTFDVREADPGFIVSLADAKAQLNITSTTNDEELRGFIEAATGVVEGDPEFGVGAVVRRSLVEIYDGGCSTIRLRHAPVVSITTVKETGTTLAASSYALRGNMIPRLTKVSGVSATWFAEGVANLEVTYVVGRPIIPANITRAAMIIIQHLWETQRSMDTRRPPTALAGEFVSAQDEFGRTFSIPKKAAELLRPQHQVNVA